MIRPNTLAYFAKQKGSFPPIANATPGKPMKEAIALLWGDPVYVIAISGGNATVSAKGHHLVLPVGSLQEKALLCVYQIDCGQGDAALIQFPDGRWMMVDGGPGRDVSNSGKIAADFLYWKMFVDQSWKKEFGYEKGPFHIDALVCTHPDADHFGGFTDMTSRVRGGVLTYGTVFHSGLGRFRCAATEYAGGAGMGQLGPVAGGALPDAFVTTLLDGFDDVRAYSRRIGGRTWTLTGSYSDWLKELAELEGKGVDKLQRAHRGLGHLPTFSPEEAECSVRVLGPVEEEWQQTRGLRYLDAASRSSMAAPSLTRNGHSVVLRLDYGGVRILLTGDLNFNSQAVLLQHVPPEEFHCDVAKACHHGSEDISATFLQAMAPLATLFSSGDNESYAHPRARALGLAGALGRPVRQGQRRFLGLNEPRAVAPLIYSTELSRSVELFPPYCVYDGAGKRVPRAEVQARGRSPQATGPRNRLSEWLLADRLVYGLINVRTDGEKIAIGVLKESDASFQVEEIVP